MVINTALGSPALRFKKYECSIHSYDKWLKEFGKCKTLENALDLAKDLAINEYDIWLYVLDNNEILLKFVIEENDDMGDYYALIYYYASEVRFVIE